MKKTFLTLVFGLSLPLFAVEPPVIVDVSAQNLFAPVGFDDNDQVEVVLDGYLPDTCYRLLKVDSQVNEETKTITIQQKAQVFKGTFCLDITVPFTSVVRLGNLKAGKYQVITRDGMLRNTLEVTASPSVVGPDNFLYAPVDEASIEYLENGKIRAWLEGRFTNTCLSMDEVKVINSGSTIEVLPLMKAVNNGTCLPKETPFKHPVVLPALKEEGRYLLHVRSLNGQSVNRVFDRSK